MKDAYEMNLLEEVSQRDRVMEMNEKADHVSKLEAELKELKEERAKDVFCREWMMKAVDDKILTQTEEG